MRDTTDTKHWQGETVAAAGRSPAAGHPPDAAQDRELLVLDGDNLSHLRAQAATLACEAGRLAPGGLGALAATRPRGLAGRPARAAVVAASPQQASARLAALVTLLDARAGHGRPVLDVTGGVFLGAGAGAGQPRVGYLFPGQGSGKGDDGGALAWRFETVSGLYRTVTLPAGDDPAATVVAQPRITRSSVAGLRVLSLLGIEATAAVGHSLGELTALHWAGAMTESELFALAAERGRVMMDASEGGGAMAAISAGPDQVEQLLSGEPVVIAGYNGPAQTVVSGPAGAVGSVRAAAAARNVKTAGVRVSHAFHSPAVAPAADELARYLAARQFQPLARQVYSTVTGDVLPADADLRRLLVRQVPRPVRFSQALSRMAPEVDLLIEVGPGRVLAALAAKITPDTPVIALGTDGPSLAGLLSAAAAAYVLGGDVRHDRLVAGSPR